MKWYFYHGALLPRIKPHENLLLDKSDQKQLLELSRAYFIRWCGEWDRGEGEFWYVIKDEKEDLQAYKSKVRNQIKKGLKNCHVKRVENSFIAKEGYRVYSNAFIKYDTFIKPLSKEEFGKSILDSSDEFWAVFDKEKRVIAYANNIIEENVCHYNSIKFDPAFLHLYPSYALIYVMNQHYLNERDFRYVNDGSRSISHQTNIQEFLIQKFRFRKAHCRLHIAYRKDIDIMVKALYPFYPFMKRVKGGVFAKINTLLQHEEIRRSFA